MIEVKNLSKDFDGKLAVDQVSFHVEKGEVLGLLGPNGAGKSTTMRMITGFLSPDSGMVALCGKNPHVDSHKVKSLLGYMPENAPLYGEMKVYEFLQYIGRLKGMPLSSLKARLKEVLTLCSLKDVISQNIETLSKGYKRRVSFAQAILSDPDILILDEPTDGLDPNQKNDVRRLIQGLSQKKSIILSTHILEEVDAVCDRVVIMAQGKKLFDGVPSELKNKSSQGRLDDVFRAMTRGEVIEGVTL